MAAKILHPDASLAWICETDPDATKILLHNHPDTPNHGDITTANWDIVEPVDLLAAGFPCQPFSIAGNQLGASDERHIWPTGVFPAIRALRPDTIWLENVPGLLGNDRGRIFAQILTDLCGIGYTIRWKTIGACMVGACHHRHRLFVSATRNEIAPPDGALFGMPIGGIGKWGAAGYCQVGEVWTEDISTCGSSQTLPTPTARDAIRGAGWGDRSGRPLSEVVAALPTPTARLGEQRGLPSPRLGASRMESGRRNLDDAVALLPTATASDHTGAGHAGMGGENLRTVACSLVQSASWGRFAVAIATHAKAIGRSAPAPTTVGPRGASRLNPELVEWMMMLPAGWVTGAPISRNAQIKALGNGVVPQQAAMAFRDM